MGDEEKKDPPPPSLSKSTETPPPPSLSKPEQAPSMPPSSGGVQEGSVKVDSQDESEGDELAHGAPAPLNTRLLGGLIDGLVATGLGVVVTFLLPDLLSKLSTVVWIGYMMTRDSIPFLKGQSIGKTAMKLKALKQDGSDLVNDWQTGVIRNILMVVPFFGPLVEAIVLVSRDGKPEKGMRLGDDFVKTKVVVWRPEDSVAETKED